MDEETDEKDSTSQNNETSIPTSPKKTKPYLFSILAIAVIAIVISGIYIYSGSQKTKLTPEPPEPSEPLDQTQLDLPDDLIFSQGFADTGRTWPQEEDDSIEEIKQNPLSKVREVYCNRVGWEYADSGGVCFDFRYGNSFNTYHDAEEGFTIYYPTLWQKDPKASNYGFTSNPKVSLRRENASCALVYGQVKENSVLAQGGESVDKVSLPFHKEGFGNTDSRALNEITQKFSRELSNEEKAAGYTDLKLIAVPHFPYTSSKSGFLLTSGNNQPLLEACARELELILNSTVVNYSTVKLSNQSNGVLSISNNSNDYETETPQRVTLLFVDSETGEIGSVAPEVFLGTQQIYSPFLSDNKLFFMEGKYDNPIIKTVDIFSGEDNTIPLEYDEAKPIHSFFVKNNILYYLTGRFCNEYKAQCKDLSLKSYNLTSGDNKVLATGSESNEIVGFTANDGALILRQADGDAGYGWGSYESYTFLNKAFENLGSYGTYIDEPSDSYTKFENLVTGSDRFDYLIIKNGKIFSPAITGIGLTDIRVNLGEYPQVK